MCIQLRVSGRAAVLCGLFIAFPVAAQTRILDPHSATRVTLLAPSATGMQDIRPMQNASQRGVNIDGTARSPSPLGWMLHGNPYEGSSGVSTIGSVRLDTGTYAPVEIDLAFPSSGRGWVVGRTFNARQQDSGSSYRDSNGYQGRNWHQAGQPEIVFYDADSNPATKGADDVVTIVYGADRFIECVRTASNADTFKARNGATGVVLFAANGSGEPETYTYHDQVGTKVTFLGFDGDAGAAAGQFWKMEDAAGNTCFVGSSTLSGSTATTGYSSGRIQYVYDPADRRYTYTYSTIDSVARLTSVKAETKTGGTWASPSGVTEVGRVDYAYYQTGDNTYGDNGNLKLVTVTTPLSDPGQADVRRTYYRYWKGAFHATTNPGHPNTIQYVMHPEGTRAFDWTDSDLTNADFLGASPSSIEPYTSHSFEYDSERRIAAVHADGDCGCSGGSNGVHTLSYGAGSYANGAARRTVVARPDGAYETTYFTESGEVNAHVLTDADPASGTPPARWVTEYVRDGDGLVTSVRTPAANTGYTHSTGTFTASATAGLVWEHSRVSTTHAQGFISQTAFRSGTGGTLTYVRGYDYADDDTTDTPEFTVVAAVGGFDLYRPVRYWDYRYNTVTSTPSAPASYAEANVEVVPVPGTLTITQQLGVAAEVSAGENGAGTVDVTGNALRADGTVAFTKGPDGVITYHEYTDGRLTRRVNDANTTTLAGQGVTIPSGYAHSGTPLHLVTTHTYDAQGRLESTTAPDGTESRLHTAQLADGRLVHIRVPRVSGGTFYGPVSCTVTNHAGKAEFSGVIDLGGAGTSTDPSGWIDDAEEDPLTALLVGSFSRVQVTLYNAAGTRAEETRAYFSVPGSLPGTKGTHFDAQERGYDDMGRTIRVKDATGTITRTVYDAIGRGTESWVGTNDNGLPGGETSGTNNMVKTSVVVYDGGSAGGNSLTTASTLDADGNWGTTGDQRTTTYAHDVRGQVLLITNPLPPHTLNAYDAQGNLTASAAYTSVAGITPGTTNPAGSGTGDKGARVALSETFYDARWRVYKSTTHQINPSTGASEATIDHLTWYDGTGRVIKRRANAVTKTAYDRIGRPIVQSTLAFDDDTTHAHAGNVSGDLVLEESHTTYDDPSGRVVVRAQIKRHPNASATAYGALYAGVPGTAYAYGDIAGRVSITAMYYDSMNRVTDTVEYGTAGITASAGSWSRPGSVATRSDSALVTSYSYNSDGTSRDVTDPMGRITRTEYDAMGRVVKRTANYVDGTPGGGANNDQDQTVRFEYANGVLVKQIADLGGGGADQETLYIYGVPKGTSAGESAIASNRLLWKAQYPDSAGGSDVVTTAYNALGERVYTKDQAGNEIETVHDALGRESVRRAATVAGGFDASIRAIELAYDDRGGVETVTQYSDTSLTTATDQVGYAYDGWGLLDTLTQDVDGVIGAGGITARSVSYTHALATPSGGAAQVRRTGMTLPGGLTLNYRYTGTVADRAGRVDSVEIELGSPDLTIASYTYLGAAQLAETTLDEPKAYAGFFDQSTTTYPSIDNFGRATTSAWLRLNGALYTDFRIAYDRNSGVLSETDELVRRKVAGGPWSVGDYYFSRLFTNDGLGRLSEAVEGHLSGGAIASGKRTRLESWELSPTGNWLTQKLDLDGDGTFGGTGERNWAGTFNKANEFTARGGNSPAYDAAGNMTDDGVNYTYVHDAFGRLTTVKTRGGSPVTVSEYRYNGLGHRIGWRSDTNHNSTVDGSDPWYWFTYDDRWRVVATYRGSDAHPKERFIHHNAGLGGLGGSSYIDSLILRDSDDPEAWINAADGTLETRHYYLQNWRHDVVALIEPDGTPFEYIRYSAYGVPTVYAAGDVNRDGVCDGYDPQDWDDYNDYGAGALAVDLDVNRDGVVDSADRALVQGHADWALWTSHGRGSVSRLHNRRGYAGYEFDPATAQWHVRNRVLVSEMGRWNRRDPLGYVDGMSVYEYVRSMPVVGTDPSGLAYDQCPSGECGVDHRVPIGDRFRYPDPLGWPAGPHRDLACERWARGACDRPGIRPHPSCYNQCRAVAGHCCAFGGSEGDCIQRGTAAGVSCVGSALTPISVCAQACYAAQVAAACGGGCAGGLVTGVILGCVAGCKTNLACLIPCLAAQPVGCVICALRVWNACVAGCSPQQRQIGFP